MAPPTIQTSIMQFSAPRATSHPDEVVIDGESSATDSDDDNDVMVITPRARKRRRTSAIMDDDDEDNEDNSNGHAARTTTAATAAQRTHNADQQDDSDDDDDVEIVQIGATATPLDGSASKKSRRLTVADSDNDDTDDASAGPHARTQATRASSNTPNPRCHSTGGVTPSSNASSSRRSSRIERKRLDKVSEPSSVRKLEYLNLDNCLDELATPSKARRTAAHGSDDDDDDTDDFEDDDAPRTRRPQREVEREGRHADGDDDLDTFIVGDNDVEYMDDDEDGVISVASGSDHDDDGGDNEDDEIAAHRAMQQTREPKEWFHLYMEYLEESILDADLDSKMRRRPYKPDYVLYREATHHIERTICSRRDNLRGNVVWPDEMLHALHHACYFRSSRCSAEQECEACNRQNHMATYSAQLGGVMCDATALYREGWMPRLRKSMLQSKTVNVTFEMGSVCHARTLAYWQLLHAKRFWCALIDDKRRSSGDVTGRIRDDVRAAFFNIEFGRYKRLLNLVDTFESEARQASAHMVNVWKKVTVQHCTSDFLPTRKQAAAAAATRETRRGAMDAFVAESEDDDDDDSDDEEDELEKKAKGDAQHASNDDEDLEEKASVHGVANGGSSSSSNAASAAAAVSEPRDRKPPASDVEDLLCLVCGENPRNGGIVHGQYLHFYSCFRCGKRQQRARMGCLVCDRPIDKVLRLLPLTPETRQAIQQQQQQSLK